jgi:sugar/nucleoside kinase (ribokinase family)
MDTMNFWISGFLDSLKEVIAKVDMLIINDEEARQLSGEYSIVKAAHKIMAMGPKILAIKKGEHGALLFHGNEMFFAPALPLAEVFDPTGAGDTFAGGMIGYLARTQDISFENLKRAIIYGSAMASFCVEKFGIQRLTELNMREIHERVEQFVRLVNFDIAYEIQWS